MNKQDKLRLLIEALDDPDILDGDMNVQEKINDLDNLLHEAAQALRGELEMYQELDIGASNKRQDAFFRKHQDKR